MNRNRNYVHTPRRNIRSQATYLIEPEYQTLSGGIRFLFKFTATKLQEEGNRANDGVAMRNISKLFQKEIKRLVLSHNPNITTVELNNIRGWLGAESLSSDAHTSLDDKSVFLKDLSEDNFLDYIYIINQSPNDVTFYSIRWSFYLYMNSIYFGSGINKKLHQDIHLSGCKPTWKNQEYISKNIQKTTNITLSTKINCAAYAINFIYNKCNRKTLNRDAYNLQTKLGWGEYVSIAQISDFIKLYPTYRITVLLKGVIDSSTYTFTGDTFTFSYTDSSNYIYLFYDAIQKHFAAVKSPQQYFCSYLHSNDIRYCHRCTIAFNSNVGHDCSTTEQQDSTELLFLENKRKLHTCKQCNISYYNFKQHKCFSIQCKTCLSYKSINERNHRCILQKDPPSSKKVYWKDGDAEDGKRVKLFTYDIESTFSYTYKPRTIEFDVDENGNFKFDDEHEVMLIYKDTSAEHIPSLICCTDVYSTDESTRHRTFKTIEDFVLTMLSINDSNNILLAHNGSGYDTRLILSQAIKCLPSTIDFKPITRGCKIMRLQIGKLSFQDSMLHLPGSLASLAESYLEDKTTLRKGYFPYLFNTTENQDYSGPIPSRNYFNLSFQMKTPEQLTSFNSWYKSQQGKTWVFQEEVLAYCKNDVDVLTEVVRTYAEIQERTYGYWPWFNLTAPSYVHDVYLINLTKDLQLEPDTKSELYQVQVGELARRGHWAVLLEEEYNFCRESLRGGRTDSVVCLKTLSQTEKDNGESIRYVDVVSLYPYCQMKYPYPVGTPKIFIFSPEFYPCHRHPKDYSCTKCSFEEKKSFVDSRLEIVEVYNTSTIDQLAMISSPTFFGFTCHSVKPNKQLIHPVLAEYSEGKCVFSLKDITCGFSTSIELQASLSYSYELVQLHRYDQYHQKTSLWSKYMKKAIIEKMRTSEPLPSTANQIRLVKGYEESFGMGEEVRDSFDNPDLGWSKKPAQKTASKIFLNCGWGKHAERINMPQLEILTPSSDEERLRHIYQNFSEGNLKVSTISKITDEKYMYKYIRNKAKPDLHKAYLPAGCFVPAYGRLVLNEQLQRLGDRVLMYDTDSIIYHNIPGEYTPPEGDILGNWKREDIDVKHGGIKEFVGLAPKSYSLLCYDGTEMTKMKGCRMSNSTKEILNHQSMKDLVLEKISSLHVPQSTFIQPLAGNMITHNFLKQIKFNKGIGKGIFNSNNKRMYPFGYEGSY